MISHPAAGRRVTAVLAGLVAVAGATLALAVSGAHDSAADTADGHSAVAPSNTTSKQVAFHDAMRKLWEDHITWTRLAIVSFAHDLPDLPATQARLLDNQVDIGNAIKPYYGRKAGERLTALLEEHIGGAVGLLKAAKAGDDAAFAAAKDAWYRNGREIARFLSDANPRFLPFARINRLMRGHLDDTLQEAALRLGGDFEADIREYEHIHRHILLMSDAISGAIIRQFPGRFR
jgi:hypothetical protein